MTLFNGEVHLPWVVVAPDDVVESFQRKEISISKTSVVEISG
jgi:hypothetical protein